MRCGGRSQETLEAGKEDSTDPSDVPQDGFYEMPRGGSSAQVSAAAQVDEARPPGERKLILLRMAGGVSRPDPTGTQQLPVSAEVMSQGRPTHWNSCVRKGWFPRTH